MESGYSPGDKIIVTRNAPPWRWGCIWDRIRWMIRERAWSVKRSPFTVKSVEPGSSIDIG